VTSTATHAGRRAPSAEVQQRPARRAASRPPAAEARGRRRLAVVYDIDGPRVRLGIAWFVLALLAMVPGTVGPAVVYGGAAALAAAQSAKAWRRAAHRPGRQARHRRPNLVVAAAVAVGVALAAAVSTALLGLAVLAGVAACVLTGGVAAGSRTLQCAVWPAAAAASVVVAYRFEPWAAVALVLAASAYEVGDFLVGSGARNAFEGPVAGALAVLVVQFGVSAFGLPPFELPEGFAFAAVAAVLCPAGQLVASLVLPSADARAPALRRLDSLLLCGPAWALLAGLAAQAQAS
jgi:hypothetical protein